MGIEQGMRFSGEVTIVLHRPVAIHRFLSFEQWIASYYHEARHRARGLKNADAVDYLRNIAHNIDTILRGNEERRRTYKNVTCTVGRTQVMKALANNSPAATYIEYCALGTGAGTPAISDTTLFTELARKTFSYSTQSDNTAEFRAFFTTSEANGTLTEIGHFLDDATGTANSGTLFNHASIAEVKTSSLTLTTIFNLTANDG